MSKLNHFAIGARLHSEIVGPMRVGHGQIASLQDPQRYFDKIASDEPISVKRRDEEVDDDLVAKAFLAVRTGRGSPDLYVADPVRNARFLAKCRELGIKASDYRINKALFDARKSKKLTGLQSAKTKTEKNFGEFAFASEFAATELRYRTGSSIEDILCDPKLAREFDAIAGKIAPGFAPFDYRWAILSIREAGRRQKLTKSFKMPEFAAGFRLMADPIERIPTQSGIYLLYERQRLLYTSSTDRLRHSVELHRNPKLIEAITENLWRPDPKNFVIEFAKVLEPRGYLQAIERRIVEERRPVFNVPRTA